MVASASASTGAAAGPRGERGDLSVEFILFGDLRRRDTDMAAFASNAVGMPGSDASAFSRAAASNAAAARASCCCASSCALSTCGCCHAHREHMRKPLLPLGERERERARGGGAIPCNATRRVAQSLVMQGGPGVPSRPWRAPCSPHASW